MGQLLPVQCSCCQALELERVQQVQTHGEAGLEEACWGACWAAGALVALVAGFWGAGELQGTWHSPVSVSVPALVRAGSMCGAVGATCIEYWARMQLL
jgi:hypothetical protein